MHIVWTVLGWVLLTLLGLLALALVVPVFVDLEYKDKKFFAVLRLFFWWKISLYPMPEKPDRPKPEAKKQDGADAADKEKSARKPVPKITLEMVWGLVSTAGAAMRIVFRSLWFTHIRVVWPVHEDTPAETAIAYGRTQAYFGGAVAALRNFLNLRKFEQVDILADYDDKFSESTQLACTIGATPVIMVIAGVYALVRVFKERLLPL